MKLTIRKAFNMVEISIVILLLVITILVCIPGIVNNTKEAKVISGWKKTFTEIDSNFELFSINDYETVETICRNNDSSAEVEVFKVLGPYLNVDTSNKPADLKSYRYKFLNGAQIPKNSKYFTRLFAYQENGNIVAFKLLSCQCTDDEPCAVALMDLNGKKHPNRIGKDIFGINIYKHKVEAFGSELSNAELVAECKRNHNGTACSEYYLRGGKF